jgi:glyoxylase-like metal-dependent hydrolase (beta-lactamase superfamily II)
MIVLTRDIGFIDLHHQGRPHVIATAVLHGPGGAALVDPGPGSALPTLRAALERAGVGVHDLRFILLTHVHLDHAGATGTLVRENPALRVFVHERGARHMIDPSRLIGSASRIYGDAMDRLWGEFVPVPEGNLEVLVGGERIQVGDRRLEVAYTPGHASHHVSYFDPESGLAFVGDTAGVRIGEAGFVLPPTPPPDIELETWKASVRRIGAWNPGALFLTHFGPATSVAPHLATLVEQMDAVARMVKDSLTGAATDEERFAGFAAAFGVHLRRHMPEEAAAAYERAAPVRFNWQGLARYWRKLEEA